MSKLLTLKQVAERLSLSLPTIRKYIDQGKLPVVQFSRAVRVEEKDLEEFIEIHRKRRGRRD